MNIMWITLLIMVIVVVVVVVVYWKLSKVNVNVPGDLPSPKCSLLCGDGIECPPQCDIVRTSLPKKCNNQCGLINGTLIQCPPPTCKFDKTDEVCQC